MRKQSVTSILFILISTVLFAQKADLSAQWAQTKTAAEKLGITLPANQLNGTLLESEKIDDDTFRTLKAKFDSDKSISAVFLVEKGATTVFNRYDRWWMPAATALIGTPLIAFGLIKDNGTMTGIGVGLSIIGAVGGFFILEKSDVSNTANDYSGNAAIFIMKK